MDSQSTTQISGVVNDKNALWISVVQRQFLLQMKSKYAGKYSIHIDCFNLKLRQYYVVDGQKNK